MRTGLKTVAGLALALSLVVGMPAQAATLTSGQISAILSMLQAFGADSSIISSVQSTLTGGASSTWSPQASSSNPFGGMLPPGQVGKMLCVQLNRSLGPGSQGSDVKSLQELLSQDPEDGFTATPTGYFGPMTEHALAHFQVRNGIASSTAQGGFAGPMTRGFFNRHCGEGLGQGNDNQERGGQGGDNARMMGILGGTITAVGSSTVTVQTQMGSTTRTVNLGASTTIEVVASTSSAPTAGTTANLTVGALVTVQGTPNQDGTFTANDIKVGILPPPPPQNGQDGQEGNDH